MTTQTPTAGRLSEIVARVEGELAAFWSTPDTARGESVAKVRAATLNYVVVCAADAMDRCRSAADQLSEVHAGRSFLVVVDGRRAPWDLDAEVSAVCRTGGDVPICYDRIELQFGAMAASRAPSVVTTLALSEVPVVVEFAEGAPTSVSEPLARRADRIVVDSSHTGLARLAGFARSSGVSIGDRAFVRAFSWRDLVARFFDDTPRWARVIRRVAVGVHAGGAEDPAKLSAPALLVGWLASRLGWRFEGPSRALDENGLPVEVSVVADDREGLARGELTSVRMSVAAPEGHRELACERISSGAVRWTIAGAGGGAISAYEHRLGFRDESWVLLKAIDSTEGDRVYKSALLAAADWSAS